MIVVPITYSSTAKLSTLPLEIKEHHQYHPLTLIHTDNGDEDWKTLHEFKTRDGDITCIVTMRSSTITSLVRKSAPIVALYWLVNFLLTYWFISDVLPTLESPNMITFKSTFFLVAMTAAGNNPALCLENSPTATCDQHTNTSVSLIKPEKKSL